MSVLTKPTAHHGLLASVVVGLTRHGEQAAGELGQDYAGPGPATQLPSMWKETIDVGVSMGVLTSSAPPSRAWAEGELAVGPNAASELDGPAQVRAWLVGAGGATPTLSDDAPAGDLTAALCWVTSLSPYDGPLSADTYEARQRSSGLPTQLVSNATQWRCLARWAIGAGLAAHVGAKSAIIPDIVEDLRRALPPSGTIDVADLLDAVTVRNPFVPEGALGGLLDADPDPNALSIPISRALRSLEHDGSIRLIELQDAGIVGTDRRTLHEDGRQLAMVEVTR